MRHFLLLFVAVFFVVAQVPDDSRRIQPADHEEDRKLPNGKSQKDEIVKADYKTNMKDAAELARMAEELKDDLEKSGSGTVSVKTLKKLDDIEKLARSIRGRLKRY